jgi:hypothetical protein
MASCLWLIAHVAAGVLFSTEERVTSPLNWPWMDRRREPDPVGPRAGPMHSCVSLHVSPGLVSFRLH